MLSKNQIKEIRALHARKGRDERRLFIAEGVKTVSEILEQQPGLVQALYATPAFVAGRRAEPGGSGVRATEVTDDELGRISLQSSPNEVLALCSYLPHTKSVPDLSSSFSFYLDEIRDPGNFGTIIRLAGWFGISTLFCSPSSCDLYNPKVIQSTMGAFLRVQVVYTELDDLLASAQAGNVYGAVLNGADLYEEKLSGGLVIIGNEANGISAANLRRVTRPITIPAGRQGGAESLNAAMAASIIASEFFRQLKGQ